MKNSRRMAFLAPALIFMSVTPRVSAQDWPQWRGPNRDDKAPDFTAPKTWPQELHQQWKVTVGQADASPALVAGKLYVFTRQEDKEVVQCLNAADGKEIWNYKYDVLAINGPAAREHAGPRSSPTVADGKVVTLGVRGVLTCLDAADGKLLWQKNDIHGWPMFFTAMSPLVVNGLCVAQLGGKADGAIVAYDLKSGDEKWKWTGDGTAYASPIAMSVGDSKLIIAQTDKRIVALNATDGKLAWEAPFQGSGMGGYNAATPVVDGQTLIYTGAGRGAIAVQFDQQGGTISAKQLWTNKDVSPRFCSPVLKDGLLFGLSEKGAFYCLNAKTGETAWQESDAHRGAFGSILDAGSELVALTPKSHLIVFQPSDKAYTEVANIKVADTDTYAQPVLTGNKLFIEDQNSVTLWTVD